MNIRNCAAVLAAAAISTICSGCSAETQQSSTPSDPVEITTSALPVTVTTPSTTLTVITDITTPPETTTVTTTTPATEATTTTVSTTPTPITTYSPETTAPPLETIIATTTTVVTTAPKPPVEPSPPKVITPSADGTVVFENDKALIDASNASQGYIMVKLKVPDPDNEYKVLIDTPNSEYTYIYVLSNAGEYEVIPITCSSGTYQVDILKLTKANKGTRVFRHDINAAISDSTLPFLTPNQYCMYGNGSLCVSKASEICGGCNEIEKIEQIYRYVLNTLTYKVTTTNSADGYVPNPDRAIRDGYGVCFDYATLMAAMLRSQGLPTKVVVGYAGSTYHAWISVYVKDIGWIDGIINFDGNTWKRMDPTYADSARDDADYKALIKYIQTPSNYTDMFYY